MTAPQRRFFPVAPLPLALIPLALTGCARYVLVRCRLEQEVGPLALFYPCTVTLFTSLLWLVLFR